MSPAASSQDPPALVLAAHGTSDPGGPRVLGALADLVRERLPDRPVVVAFVDVIGPTLADVLVDLLGGVSGPAGGPRRAVVVPVFLGTGYHVEVDIPRAAAAYGERVLLTPALGPAPEVVRAVADRLAAADADRLAAAGATGALRSSGPVAAVVLAAAGSSRERSRRETVAAAAALESLLSLPVTVGFASAAAPSVAEAVRQARTAHAAAQAGGAVTVGVASYLLAPGSFQDRLHQAGADLVSAPIGAHPAVGDLVVRRYREAIVTAATVATAGT